MWRMPKSRKRIQQNKPETTKMKCLNCGHLVEECLPDEWYHGNKLSSGGWYHGQSCSQGIKRKCGCTKPEPKKEPSQ